MTYNTGGIDGAVADGYAAPALYTRGLITKQSKQHVVMAAYTTLLQKETACTKTSTTADFNP